MKDNEVIICINNLDGTHDLTIGKEYVVISYINPETYTVINKNIDRDIIVLVTCDTGDAMYYKQKLFLTREDYREKQLNEILCQK